MGRLRRAAAVLLGAVLLGAVLPGPGPGAAGAAAPDSESPRADDEVVLTLFWGDGCPHCEAEKEWLADAVEDYPQLTVRSYEVWHDERNRVLLEETAAEMGFEPTGAPVTIIGERHWIGWSDAVRDEVEAVVDGTAPATDEGARGGTSRVDVPLLGDVEVSSDSLVFSTLVIGFVDGVNPCSLWVISVLLAIVVRTGSRRRVAAIGGTFLVVTAAMYAVYMAGIYSAMGVLGHLGAIQAQGVGFAEAAFLFALYMLPFLVDELVVFGLAVATMRVAKMQERHGRLLKLVGGTMMLALAITVLVEPSAMSDPATALAVFALLVAGVVHLVTRAVGQGRRSPQVDPTR